MTLDNKYPTAGDPYVGLASLHKFDEAIIACMALNDNIAPQTHNIKMTDLQSAAVQIIPAGISLSLSEGTVSPIKRPLDKGPFNR